MQNFMKTILSAVQCWTKGKIKDSVADWNENDSSKDSYVKNRTHWMDDDGVVHKLDPKYLDLPTNLATTDDVESAKQETLDVANTAQSTADSKMDATNPVGTGSFSMNRQSGTIVGEYSTALGVNCTASGKYSLAAGRLCSATGYSSISIGDGASAKEDYSIAINGSSSGRSAVSIGKTASANGINSLANGYSATANGEYSVAIGRHTVATGNDSHVFGVFNVEDTGNKYIHIVGNGTLNTARSNAHTLDWDGNAWYHGNVYVGSTSGTNRDDGSKKLATEEYVDSAVADKITAPATASVGQLLAVKAVDENGIPTEWGVVTLSLSTDESGVITIVATE